MSKVEKTPVQSEEQPVEEQSTEEVQTEPVEPETPAKEMISIPKEEYELLCQYRKIVVDAMTNIRRVHDASIGDDAKGQGLTDDQMLKKRREAIKARRAIAGKR